MLSLIIHTPKGQHVANVPEQWNELTRAQLLKVASALFTEADALKQMLRIAYALCGIEWALFRRLPETAIVEQIVPEIKWVFESCQLTEQLLPVLDDGSYHGPQSHLRNLLFHEFDAAERALFEWHQDTTSFDALCRFVAIIYRPAKPHYDLVLNPDGDVREPYNEHLTDAYAAAMRLAIRQEEALAVMLWYKGCREYMAGCFPSIFNQAAAEGEATQSPAYFGLIRAIAKEGIYGTYDEVERLPVYNIFSELQAAQEEREAMENAVTG